MGSMDQLTQYISKLAQTAAAFRPSLKNTEKKTKPIDWKPEHNTAFDNILKLVSEITQNEHFEQQLDTLIVCMSLRQV